MVSIEERIQWKIEAAADLVKQAEYVEQHAKAWRKEAELLILEAEKLKEKTQ